MRSDWSQSAVCFSVTQGGVGAHQTFDFLEGTVHVHMWKWKYILADYKHFDKYFHTEVFGIIAFATRHAVSKDLPFSEPLSQTSWLLLGQRPVMRIEIHNRDCGRDFWRYPLQTVPPRSPSAIVSEIQECAITTCKHGQWPVESLSP
jgi:hypothetical protein